ncbi:MAG: aryl-sulfate sulfotransferase [Lachnospiraceae bacterium]|nr:aryl-sulfate sulfotransferase [Lachnospiraceae bacterium]
MMNCKSRFAAVFFLVIGIFAGAAMPSPVYAAEDAAAEGTMEETAAEDVSEAGAAETDSPVVYNVSGWQICLEDASRAASLSSVSVSLGYTSVETTDLEQSAADGYEYCMLKLSFVKDGSTEAIKWENMLLTDGDGGSYSRMDDSFIEDYGMSRLPGTDLNFGSYEGWICFEIPEEAGNLTLTYTFESEELSIPVVIAEEESEAESEAEAGETAESESETGATEATKADTESEAGETVESESESGETEATKADTESETGETAESESETGATDVTKADTESETAAAAESESETESESEAETETETEKPVPQETLYDVDGRSYTVVSSEALAIETDIKTELTMPEQTQAISDAIVAEVEENASTFDDPLVIQNPYQYTPLTAVVAFRTEEDCEVRVTVKGKTEEQDITDTIDAASLHIVPVLGLYAGYENEVVLELLDSDGTVTDTRTITIETESLPYDLREEVEVGSYTTESSMDLMLVSGLSAPYAYAFDETGEIRWYCTVEWEYYGVFTLENGHFLIEAENVLYPNASMSNSPEFWEMDYLGRIYNVYYFPQGVHHDIQEMTPDGNFLILTNSNDGYEQNMIQEIDRETGEVVKSLNLNELFAGLEYIDRDDWCHTNTVSYDEDTDSILISCRNLHSVIRIDWSSDEILWILSDPTVWEGTGYEDKVLAATEEFQWHYQQHTAYALEEDLDGNPDTTEIMLFDNHYAYYRMVDSYDYTEASYVKIYSVDAENMTVTQLKNFETAYSLITSDAFYMSEENRVFSVNAYLPSSSENRGQVYEIDYDTGEILNTWKISHKFYRGYAVSFSANDCAGVYTMPDNCVKGTLRTPVEVTEPVSAAGNEALSAEKVSVGIRGSVLYLYSGDHMYTQVIFNGTEHTYVYDITDILLLSDEVDSYHYGLPIPLTELAADTYTLQIMYDDELYEIEGSFTIS